MSFSEIAAWMELSGVDLDFWEIETIRGLSATYVSASQYYSREENKEADPPYMGPKTQEHLEAQYIQNRMASVAKTNADLAAKLEKKRLADEAQHIEAEQQVAEETPDPTKYKTKADHARSVISKGPVMSKEELIEVLISDCGMSAGYAKTFYRNEFGAQ